jgi:hypothetical protein
MPVGRILMLADGVKCRHVLALTVQARSDTLMIVGILGRVLRRRETPRQRRGYRSRVRLRRDKVFNRCSFLILGRGGTVCW